ncbi:hypothetical protein H072_2826 [Dactylellina haptotyla CBS 200.50]|uniref:DNA helicase n=1 Tax=Dactylellina haptotyla (strain CBS 200.50) TaxID=1284197 RepID=S8AJV1_DACHA|nr:hypothetical protein H072_2826 [Dactylellina haptotyla CBS 200.50]
MTPDDQKSDPEAPQNDRNGHLPATRSSSRTSKPLHIDTDAAKNISPDSPPNNEVQQLMNPSKKRKLNNGPISPPWKSAAAQTPSSFIDDSGRKRSMRTMPPPTPVTPARDRRPRRLVSTKDTPDTGSSRTRTKEYRPGTRTSPRSIKQQRTPVSTSRSAGAKSQHRPNGKQTPQSASRNSITVNSKQARQNAQDGTSARSSAQKRTRNGSFSASTAPRRRSGRLATAEEPTGQGEDDEDEDFEMRNESEGFDEEEYDSSKRISWRLKFSRKVKPPLICNVGNMALPAKFSSLREYFEAEDNNLEYLKQMQDAAELEANKRIKLEEAFENGDLRPENLLSVNTQLVPPAERLRPQWGHQDHLVNHAIRFSKLLKRERMQHIKDAKAIAKDAAEAARKRRPKTREQIEAEQRDMSIKRYRDVVASFKLKLKLTEKAAQDVRREKYLEAHRLANRESLKQMLHHSSQLLNTRIQTRQGLGEEADDESHINEDMEQFGEDIEEVGEEDTSQSAFSGDASNMSDSESESEEESDGEEDADDQLSPDELRRKYASLADIKGENISEVDVTDASMSMDEVAESEVFADADLPEDSKASWHDDESVELTVEELDQSDEDIPMDSEDDMSEGDMDEEDYDGGDDDKDGEDDEDEEDAEDGLFGFFSKDDIEKMRQQGVREAEPLEELSESGPPEDDEDLEEVDMVPVNMGENENIVDEYSEVDAITEAEHTNDHGKVLHPNATSDDSSVAKTGVSEVSSVTTPASIGLAGDHKEAPKLPISSLLRGTLREYQHHGLEWLANLYENGTNGILADEMGLGKTIQTIALISHLATSYGIWGPHLVVVPTSVILNWEMEFKKWAPGFKIMTYYGSREERQEKRKGWMDYDAWDVCITSYQLVVQDAQPFKRRSWHYLILDEAHNIKNFRSQRWQTLLNFKAHSRLLLTGTPLQNNLIELWSLLYFLMPSGSGMSNVMPHGFTNLKEFQEWFARPVDQLIEGGREGMDEESRDSIKKLHTILRPYLLRRLKKDVEKQMPEKHEHIVWCRLSKRQRFLYDDFMSRAQTRETLTTGNYLSIINCLMQLRKVCNHPDLFETRPIVTSYAMRKSAIADFEIKELFVRKKLFQESVFDEINLDTLNLNIAKAESKTRILTDSTSKLVAQRAINEHIADLEQEIQPRLQPDFTSSKTFNAYISNIDKMYHLEIIKQRKYLNNIRCRERPIYGTDLHKACSIGAQPSYTSAMPAARKKQTDWLWNRVRVLEDITPTLASRAEEFDTVIQKFGCVTPAVVVSDLPSIAVTPLGQEVVKLVKAKKLDDPFHRSRNRLSIAFPDKRLLQYDCGKLQKLDTLLRHLQEGGHRALIFTQMTKVLDILEQFLNIHGHRYLRLDGATKVEQRQILTERFNNDNRILVFILSTRSGGLGLNLTGADSVIFYDLDWNPAMDKQCQDRCHRIGQTRDVHIYRFVSEFTIESNILRKSTQKQMLDDVVIQEGEFTVDKFNRLTVADLFGDDAKKFGLESIGGLTIGSAHGNNMNSALEQVEDADDVVAAKAASKEAVENLDKEDFGREDVPKAVAAGPSVVSDREQDATKGSVTPRNSENPSTPVVSTTPAVATANDEVEEEEQQEEEDDNFRTVDDYLIRFWEWDLRDTPVIIPDKNKKKSKKTKPP